MSKHVHIICRSKNDNLFNVIRDFKKFTSKKIMGEVASNVKESRRNWLEMIFKYHAKFNKRSSDKQFWTHENHSIELENNSLFESKLNYIHQNPVRAGWVEREEDYLYSSVRNFTTLDYLLQIDKIQKRSYKLRLVGEPEGFEPIS